MNLKNWLLACRPKTLWAAVCPVLIGTSMAFADGDFHLFSALAAFIGALLIQIGTNFANDYYDFLKGADTAERLGPIRATQAGLIQPGLMKKGFIIAFGLAMLIGLYLVWRGGWVIVLIGSISIFLGVLYTATPWALAYTGLADFFVLIFFGPVAVGGTYYVQTLAITDAVLVAGLAPGLFSMAILTVNNLRDIEQDRKAGRKTLAVRFGRTFAKTEYVLAILLACGTPLLVYACTTHKIGDYGLIACVTVLLSLPLLKTVLQNDAPEELNSILAKTGKLLLVFSLLFSIGWAL